MKTFLIPVFISLIITIAVKFYPPQLPLLEKALRWIHFISGILALFCIAMVTSYYRFAGPYTNLFIALTCICSGTLLYGFSGSRGMRIYAGFVAWPTLISVVAYYLNLFLLLIPALIGYMIFAPPDSSVKINSEYRLERDQGMIKSPLNNFNLQKKTMLFFEKQVWLERAAYHHPIDDLTIAGFKENEYVVIRHREMDSTRIVMRTDTLKFR